MPSICAVVNCNDRYGHSENVSFHKFPLKRPDLLALWESFIQRQRGADWHASRWTSLCSRHFREDDFRSFNERKTLKKFAIPSVQGEGKIKSKKIVAHVERAADAGDSELTEIMAIKERLEDVGGATKTNCRLCGIGCVAAASFASNYELYGILQKCFPTLNIQEEGDLPKALCAACYRDLKRFGDFVDKVWTAQTELQRKYRSRASEKLVKIKQEPLVRVKQEVAEYSYDQNQNDSYGAGNEDYDAIMAESAHEEGEDSGTVDHKNELCDFPIINDCDIMEIINLDDPFISIPDDDNTEVQTQELGRSSIERVNYLPSAHELLQEHLLNEEHNYACVDTEVCKEERQVYKTEKTENEDRSQETTAFIRDNGIVTDGICLSTNANKLHCSQQNENYYNSENSQKRALKPIVTSVSAIQQPGKANSIIVLNESIVQSGGGFQPHECMVCQLKFFSIGSLKEHYTQTHGTPMVSVPAANIALEKSNESTCKTEKEISDTPKYVEMVESTGSTNNSDMRCKGIPLVTDPTDLIVMEKSMHRMCKTENEICEAPKCTESANVSDRTIPNETVNNFVNYNLDNCTNTVSQVLQVKSNSNIKTNLVNEDKFKSSKKITSKQLMHSTPRRFKKKERQISLNIMVSQYQQLKKLYQRLQRKCINLEQNVEQLQLQPSPEAKRHISTSKITKSRPKTSNITETNCIIANGNRATSYSCPICSKTFSNSNSFRQHKITHTDERRHTCSLCERSFKRRNGLQQHLKGFHMQVKPYACEVCKHSYALKCDMLRCKHSDLRTGKCTTD